MAKVQDCLHHLDQALKLYEQYDQLVPGQPEVINQIGELRYQLQKAREKAAEDAARNEAAARSAATAQIRQEYSNDLQQGIEFFRNGDFATAIDAFKSGAAKIPTEQAPYLYLARSYAARGESGPAVDALRNAAQAGRLTTAQLESFVELASLVTDSGFRRFVQESLGGTEARGIPQLRQKYLDSLIESLPHVEIRGYGGDTDRYMLSQELRRGDSACVLNVTINDDFRRSSKIIEQEIQQRITLPLDRVGSLTLESESGPTTAILRIASHEKDRPTRLADRWYANVKAEGGEYAFSIARREYQSQAEGMFISHTPKELNTETRSAAVPFYLADKKVDAQLAFRRLYLAVQLCKDMR